MKRAFFTIFSVPLTLIIIFVFLNSGGIIGIFPLLPASGHEIAFAQEKGLSKVIFKVKCYDEGKAALSGLKGIQKIETGFHYIHETDTVYYDPKMITIDEMETALKKAGTYMETITEKERN
jgi:copper chaperone CopZ